MKRLLYALVLLILAVPVFAQNADDPATKDDVILYLRTMHSHDLMKRTMEVQAQSMQQLLKVQLQKDNPNLSAGYDARMAKLLSDLVKNMPVDELTEVMIPSYQKHFTHGDIEAMNAFYSSPVGQKVLEELPAVMQEGMQAAMPMLSKYLSDWQEKVKAEFAPAKQTSGSGSPTSDK